VPVPRRPEPEPEYRPGEECLELQGRLRRGRRRNPVGDAGRGVSFHHALEMLKREHFPLAAGPIQPVKQSTVRKLPAPVTAEAGDRELLLKIVGFYQDAFNQSPEAQRYLESRGLKSAEMVERFRLGFANRTLGLCLPPKNRVAGAAVRTRLEELGIYRKSGHEHFNGSLVIR